MATDTQSPAEVTAPVAAPATPSAAKRSLYQRFRAYVQDTPWLFHAVRTARFAATVGPLRPLWVGYYRRFTRNAPIETTATSMFADFDPAAAAQQLERDGFAPGLRLPNDIVEQILQWCGPPESYVSRFNFHLDCPAADAVVRDPNLIDTARRYLGVEPTFIRTDIWSSKPSKTMQHGNRFHFDVPDVKSMTAFFYLTDVDDDGGPHMVIRGTHRRKTLRQCAQIYLSDDRASRAYGEQLLKITGSRGTGFCEEQTIFHKGLPTRRYRLLFCAIYGLHRRADLA